MEPLRAILIRLYWPENWDRATNWPPPTKAMSIGPCTAEEARGFTADIAILMRKPEPTAEDDLSLCMFKECLAHSTHRIVSIVEGR